MIRKLIFNIRNSIQKEFARKKNHRPHGGRRQGARRTYVLRKYSRRTSPLARACRASGRSGQGLVGALETVPARCRSRTPLHFRACCSSTVAGSLPVKEAGAALR